MTALLDTHTLLWMVDDESRLSATAFVFVKDPRNTLYFSMASAWEIAIKIGRGRLGQRIPSRIVGGDSTQMSVELFPISTNHLVSLTTLGEHHRDPFDRLLAAKCLAENLPVVSVDAGFDAYGVRRMW